MFQYTKWFIDSFSHPPNWIVFIVITVAISYVFRDILKVLKVKEPGLSSLIFVLEIILCIVLSTITLHSYFEHTINTGATLQEPQNPLLFVILLIAVTFISMILFMIAKKYFSD